MSTDQSATSSPSEELLLASKSPRRRELLRQIGVGFRCVDHAVDELRLDRETPGDFVIRMAQEKARSVQDVDFSNPQPVILGADTIVVCDQQIMGKPQDRDDALDMLSALSGKEHQVFTAVAIARGPDLAVLVSETVVEFMQIEDAQIQQYWETGEPRGKAGAYAIQGLGGVFVKQISGSYSGVVGLPLYETSLLLNRFGIRCWQGAVEELDSKQ
jgi:septum formation protein